MKCEDCKWWDGTGYQLGCGRCRRYPPTFETNGMTTPEGSMYDIGSSPEWPTTNAKDWCGEFGQQEERGDG